MLLIKNIFRFIFVVKNRIKYRNKCVLYIQKIVRGYLVRKQHQPRYRGIIKIKLLKEKLQQSTDIVNQVKGSEKVAILKQTNDIEHLIDGIVKKIQNDSHINPKTIDKLYTDINTKIDSYNKTLQSNGSIICHANEGKPNIKTTKMMEVTEKMQRSNLNKSGPVVKPRKAVKRLREIMPKFGTRFDKFAHFPAFGLERVRCKLEGCALKSVYYCKKCNVHLCIKETDCFFKFHNLTEDSE